MCDFHSILGIALGDQYELKHDPGNSHAAMAGGLKNKPNRQPVIFEAEASAGKLLACPDADSIKSAIIRNFSECPEPLARKIVAHYQKVKEALEDGRHLTPNGYFADTSKYCDVWNEAISRGVSVTLPEVFRGDLSAYGSAVLNAPALKEVCGYLVVDGSAKLDALGKVGGGLSVCGKAKLDAPVLGEVGGGLYVDGSAKLDALVTVGGYLYVSGSAKLDALVTVGGNLRVCGKAKLDAPVLREVGGDLSAYGSAVLNAPVLVTVGGNLYVSGSAGLNAPALKSIYPGDNF